MALVRCTILLPQIHPGKVSIHQSLTDLTQLWLLGDPTDHLSGVVQEVGHGEFMAHGDLLGHGVARLTIDMSGREQDMDHLLTVGLQVFLAKDIINW